MFIASAALDQTPKTLLGSFQPQFPLRYGSTYCLKFILDLLKILIAMLGGQSFNTG